jgi:potassium channel subfamily K protein 1
VIVERMLVPVARLQLWMSRRLTRCSVFSVRLLHACLLGAFVLVFILLLPAVAFYFLEPGWDYLDSVYYLFISLTTIGLGDFVPGDAPSQPYRPLYKILAMGEFIHVFFFSFFSLWFLQGGRERQTPCHIQRL